MNITFDAAKHAYQIDGEPVPSVTQILGIIDKSGPLSWWGQGIGVEGVCRLHNAGEEIPWDDPPGVVKLLTVKKLTTNHMKTKAGTRGTSLHDALEAYLTREAIPNAADFPEADRGYVQALARALADLRPEPLEAEVIVGSREHGYAGRFDLLAVVEGLVTRVDLKSSRGVFAEQMFPQLAAYEYAAVECGHQPSERQCILRVGADGEYEWVTSTATIEDFLAVKGCYDVVQRLKKRAPRRKKVAA